MLVSAHPGSAVRHVAHHEIWFTVGLVAISVLSLRLAEPVVAALAALAAVRWIAERRITIPTFADWCIAALVLMLPVTLWATAQLDVTRLQVCRLLTGVALYYSIVNWAVDSARLRFLWSGFALCGLCLSLGAFLSVEWVRTDKLSFIPAAVYGRLPVLQSDAIHPNIMAGALVIQLPCVLASLLFRWPQTRWSMRMLGGLTSMAMFGVLVLTKSRGGLLAGTAAILLLGVLRWPRTIMVMPSVALAGAAVLWRTGSLRMIEVVSAGSTLGGLDTRIGYWSSALNMIEDFPFTGIGMGTFRRVSDPLLPFFMPNSDSGIPHAHNIFLQVGVDLGLLGLIAWIAVLLLTVLSAWRIYSAGTKQSNSWWACFGAGLLCSQIALVLHGLLDAATWGTRPAVIVWAIWGLTAAAGNLVGQKTWSSRAERAAQSSVL